MTQTDTTLDLVSVPTACSRLGLNLDKVRERLRQQPDVAKSMLVRVGPLRMVRECDLPRLVELAKPKTVRG